MRSILPHQYLPLIKHLPGFTTFGRMHQHVECWSTDNGAAIGSTIKDHVDGDCMWMILGKDQKGIYRMIDMGVGLPSLAACSVELQAKMKDLEAMGETSYPQDEPDPVLVQQTTDIMKQLLGGAQVYN